MTLLAQSVAIKQRELELLESTHLDDAVFLGMMKTLPTFNSDGQEPEALHPGYSNDTTAESVREDNPGEAPKEDKANPSGNLAFFS
jgi:hypothetical protein